MMNLNQRIQGCILGTAIGDAIGLPREGMSRRRAGRLFGDAPLQHRLIGRYGMCSDDTEHTIMVAQALIASGGNPDRFACDLARRLRWWLLRLPAGVGLGTLRACLKLWLGFGPYQSGVCSAGNGPAMRSALIGLVADNDEFVTEFVRASTRITHTDPRAEQGALLIAVAGRLIATERAMPIDVALVADRLMPVVEDTELRNAMDAVFHIAREGLTATQFADRSGMSKGVSDYVVQTVPAAIYCWLIHQGDLRNAVESAVLLGGDTDTVGAITGALAGAQLGPDAIPEQWFAGLSEWPCNVAWMSSLADCLADSVLNPLAASPSSVSSLLLLVRNFIFALIVITHGLRRLLPPY